MAKAKKRFYEIAPGWPGGRYAGAPMKFDGWSGGLTTSNSFEYMETRFAKRIADGGQVRTKPRPVPDLIADANDVPIVTSTIKSLLETIAPDEVEFRSFALRWQDDTPFMGDGRYLCNILNRVDCFDFSYIGNEPPQIKAVSLGGEPLTPEESWLREGLHNQIIPRPNYIDRAKVSGFHIWRPRWCARRIFITSDLLKALRDAGVKGLHVERLFTRDDP
jgi:hypothetical protein